MDIKIGQKVTIITQGQMLANTIKAEIIITRKIGERFVYRQKNKRKEYYLNLDKDGLVFDGWDLPIDSNTNENYTENGCVSFMLCGSGISLINKEAPQDVEATRKWIEEKNLNENFTDKKNLSLHFQGKELARLYPELQ